MRNAVLRVHMTDIYIDEHAFSGTLVWLAVNPLAITFLIEDVTWSLSRESFIEALANEGSCVGDGDALISVGGDTVFLTLKGRNSTSIVELDQETVEQFLESVDKIMTVEAARQWTSAELVQSIDAFLRDK